MSDRIILVTDPDDFLESGLRILLVDLDESQAQTVSTCLTNIQSTPINLVLYIWKNVDDPVWLLDKNLKADLIIFNAESQHREIVGFMAAQHNSYYFGNLKTLQKANTSCILDSHQLSDLLHKEILTYGK